MSGHFNFDKVTVKHSNGVQISAKPNTPCCSECGQKASLFISAVDAQGKTTSKAFCLLHALKEGLFHPKAWDLLGGCTPLHRPEVKTCTCGMTENLIRAKGRVGCAHCYKTFSDVIGPILKSLHHATVHAGKAPLKAATPVNLRRRIAILEESMTHAIKVEAYEQAAVCRDQIKELMMATNK